MSYLVIDFGTSSCRASIVSSRGVIKSTSRETVEVSVNGSEVEINTDYIWNTVISVIDHELCKNPKEIIEAIGVSAMLGYVFLDVQDKPVRPAIIWMDNRAVNEARDIEKIFGINGLYKKTGRRLSPELLAPKLLWLRNNETETYHRITTVIGLKDEIVRRLTGVVQTDIIHLNYSFLYNVNSCKIDDSIVSALNIDKDLFPEGKYAYEIAGNISKRCMDITGLKEGIPVVSGSTDGTTAMYGGGILDRKKSVLVSGTTDVFMMIADKMKPDPNCILSINNGMLKGTFAVGGAMGMSGGALKRVLDLFNMDYSDMIEKLVNTSPGADGLLFTPGLTGERAPYWAENFNGSLVGLNLSHKAEDVVRALFEGASYRLFRLIQVMEENGLVPEEINVVGGGSEIDIYNQIRADITGIPIVGLEHTEATTLGTAVFCHIGIGDSINPAETGMEWIKPKKVFNPDTTKRKFYLQQSKIFERYIKQTIDIQNDLKEGLIL